MDQYCPGKNPAQCCLRGSRQYCTWQILVQCCPRGKHLVRVNTLCNVVEEAPDNIAQEKILFNVVLLLLKQHCTCKNLEQCCPRYYRQDCTGKILFYVAVILLSIAQVKTLFNVAQETPENIVQEKNPVQCHLKNIWSLFGDFCFRPGIFLIISDCCKCRANITQISPTLHKKNPALALNKKARLYGTVSTAPCIWRGFLLFQNFNYSLK